MSSTVEISDFWVRIIKSPMYFVVAGLTGVGLGAGPLVMHQLGRDGEPMWSWWVGLNAALIWFVASFYASLSAHVMAQIRKTDNSPRVRATGTTVGDQLK